MPWTVAHPAAPGGRAPGQHAGWLGKAFDPFRVEGDPNAPGFQVGGLDAARRGRRPTGSPPAASCSASPAPSAARPASRPGTTSRSRALDALVSAEARGAFQLEREDPRLRDRYGRHIHGQCLLLARRLVEAGVAARDGQLARRRPELLGHARRQLQPSQEPPHAPGRPRLRRAARRPGRPRACSTRPWSSGSASSAATRRSPPATPAASTGRAATRPSWPAAGIRGRPGLRRVRPLGRLPAHATRSAPTTWAPRSSTPSASTRATRSIDSLGRPMRINAGRPVTALFG